VGGTKIALGLVGAGGELLQRARIENREAPDAGALLERVAAAARELVGSAGTAAVAVGVGICELVDRSGEIRSAVTIPWTRADVDEALSPLGPVTVDADVRTAALAEARVGAGRPFGSFVYVTVGTGVSCCLVRGGEPDPGARGFAQLIGSSRVTVPCGEDGGRLLTVAAEDVAAGPAIARRFAARTGEAASTEEVLRRCAEGDAAAVAVVGEAATVLGSFAALLVNVLDPDAVVIGGGLGAAQGPYWAALEPAVREHVWADDARSLPVVRAALGADAGVVGAALLALLRAPKRGR
jgi:glucokinase